MPPTVIARIMATAPAREPVCAAGVPGDSDGESGGGDHFWLTVEWFCFIAHNEDNPAGGEKSEEGDDAEVVHSIHGVSSKSITYRYFPPGQKTRNESYAGGD